MNPTPLISILTPCWNAARFLPETYASLRAQTLGDWEWIIADDGSTDDSAARAEAIAREDPRVRALRLPHSGLPAAGRNAALAQARGAFIALLDADDLFLPEKLERQAALMRARPEIGMTWCRAQEFWSDDPSKPAPVIWPRIDLPDRAFDALLRRGNPVCTSTMFFRREAMDAAGRFDEGPDLRAMEDHEYLMRVASRFPIARTEGVHARYRLHAENISRAPQISRVAALKDRLEKRGELAGPAGRAFLSNFYSARAEARLAGAEPGDCRSDFGRAWKLDPANPRRAAGLLSFVLPRAAMLGLYRKLKRAQARLEGERAAPHPFAIDR